MKRQIIIQEEDWSESVYRTKEWEDSVDLIRWEHDYVKKQYIIDFKDK